jgi:hypothetical protein
MYAMEIYSVSANSIIFRSKIMRIAKLILGCVVAVVMVYSAPLLAQCPTCGNGTTDVGETQVNCPQDLPHAATCTSPCAQPAPYASAGGLRQLYNFSGTTTYGAAALPAGWAFASGPTSTTSGTLAAAGTDAYGAKAGLVQPNCSGSCTSTNGFCIGNLASTQAVGSGGSGGKLGANFDGVPNVNSNLSYAVLRGQGNPTLVSPTYSMAAVTGFKVQFFLFPSETSCGQSNSWGSCVGNAAYLDFSSNGGTSWNQVMQMDISASNSDMCLNNSSNTQWIRESSWSRVCLTVYKDAAADGNFYPSVTGTTAASGMMMNADYFTSSFKYRIRYSQTASCTAGISTTNPGRYLAIDFAAITTGNELIPCGLSFINMCGYGADAHDDGVGSTATGTTTVFGTVRRSPNHAERGVEIFTSQTAAFAAQNLSGSTFTTNFDLCNAEGGDKQCIDWRSNNNSYLAVYEVLSDIEFASGTPTVQYYKGTTPQSVPMTKVTAAGRTPTTGWRYQAFRTVNCGSSGSDLNPGCNGYSFLAQVPTQMARGFYSLAVNSTGQAWPVYGATSCSNYFNGPFFAPVSVPDTVAGSPNYTFCDPGNVLVFHGLVDGCQDASGLTGAASLSVTGPGGFSTTFASGTTSTVPIVTPGTYTVTAQPSALPAQCVACGRSVCVTVTAADISACNTPLSAAEVALAAERVDAGVELRWHLVGQVDAQAFQVERRTLEGEFTVLCSLAADGGPTYRWTDEAPPAAVAAYRLRFLQQDGTWRSTTATWVGPAPDHGLRVAPNPASGAVQVQWPGQALLRMELCDLAGRTVRAQASEGHQAAFELEGIPVGVYVLRVWAAGQSAAVRLDVR